MDDLTGPAFREAPPADGGRAGGEPPPHDPAAGRPPLDLLAAVVEHVRDAVCLTTSDLEDGPTIIHVNAAFTAMTGYERADVLGRTPYLLHGPATDPSVLARLRENLRAGHQATAELVNYRRDGSEFWVRLCVTPIRDGRGAVTHHLGLLRDATEERAAEATGQIYLAVLQQTTDAVAIVDECGQLTYVNAAVVALTGRTSAELLGRSVRATGLTPRRLRVYREIIAALETQREWRGEYESSTRSGESRRLAVSVTRVDTVDSATSFAVDARDVTHERRLEYIAEATNLMENVGYVFASLRHELGNPINSIKIALTVLRQGLASMPRERVEDYLDRVLAETGRVEYLLRSLQSFNTMHRPTLEPVPVAPFVERFCAMVRQDVSRRGVALAIEVDDDIGAAIADPSALHQVMLNLITNALDALAGHPAPRIRIGARRGASHVRLFVSDNGRGIPADQRERIFQPFHTTKPKGTGLGLAITRKLVTLMRGTIALEPSHTRETTFAVTLDAADAAQSERRPPTLWPPSNRSGR